MMKETLIADLKPGDRFHNLIAARSGAEWKEAFFPHAFSVLSVPDGGLLFRAWFDDAYNVKVKNIYQEVYSEVK